MLLATSGVNDTAMILVNLPSHDSENAKSALGGVNDTA
jgi:hypothetical protein